MSKRRAVLRVSILGILAAGVLSILGFLLSGAASAQPTCTDSWVGGASGAPTDWNTASNWSTDVVPGPADFVCMAATSQSLATVVIGNSQSAEVAGISFPATQTLSPSLTVGLSASLTLGSDDSTVDNLTVDDGSLLGISSTTNSNITVSGSGSLTETAQLDDVSLFVDGTTTIPKTQQAAVDANSVLEVQSGGTLTLDDEASISGDGTGTVTVDQGGTLSYAGVSTSDSGTIGTALDDNGSVKATIGPLDLEGGGILGPDASASGTSGGVPLVTIIDDSDFSAATGTTGSIDGLQLGNSGEIGPGNFVLTSGSTATFNDANGVTGGGSLAVASGATLLMAPIQSESMSGASTIDNSGTVEFQGSNSGNASLQCQETTDQLINEATGTIELIAGSTGQTASIGCSLVNSGTLSATFGSLLLDGTTTFGPNAVATNSQNGQVVVDVDAVAQPPAPVEGVDQTGSISGVTFANGSDIDGPGTLVNDVTGATVTFKGPNLGAGAIVSNGLGETLHLAASSSTNLSQTSQIENFGSLTMGDGAQVQDSDNAGNTLVNESGGTISYDGSLQTASASLNLPVSNLGTIEAENGTLSADLLISSFTQTGTLTGGTYSVNGTFDIPEIASISADATTYGVSPNLSVDDSDVAVGANGVIDTSASTLGSLSSIAKGASLTSGATVTLGAALSNSGTLTLTGGTLTTTGAVTLAGGSATTVDGGATLQAGSTGNGTITLAAPGSAAAPILGGAGSVDGVVSNVGGQVLPSLEAGALSGGALQVGESSAAFKQPTPASGPSPTLEATIASSGSVVGTDFSQLNVNGPVTLGGALDIQSLPSYTPTAGDTFTILMGTTVTGHFATINGAAIGSSGLSFAVSYTATSVVLTAATPSVQSISPDPIGRGASGVPVTITGLDFGSSDTVSGVAGVTFTNVVDVNSQSLTAVAAVSSTAATGAGGLTVTPGTGSPVSCASCFTIDAAPTVTKLSVPTLGLGASKVSDVVTGTGFVSSVSHALTVSITGPSTTVTGTISGSVSGTSFTMLVSVPATAKTGEYSVSVHNGDYGVGGCSNCLKVEIIPAITAVAPSKLGQSATNVPITITGSNFTTGATLTCSNTLVTFSTVVVKSSSQITAKVTVKSTAKTGVANLTVSDPGQGSTTKTSAITVDAAPHPTSLSPASEKQGTTSATVLVKGTGFVSKDVVKFSGAGVTDTVVSNVGSTEIEIKVTVSKAAAVAKYSVTVTNPDGGTATCVGCFSVTKAAAASRTTGTRALAAGSSSILPAGHEQARAYGHDGQTARASHQLEPARRTGEPAAERTRRQRP